MSSSSTANDEPGSGVEPLLQTRARASAGNGAEAGPGRRARTDAQMAQKRRTDRLKHKVNRAENKTRLENMEKDISELKDTVQELVSLLRSSQANGSGASLSLASHGSADGAMNPADLRLWPPSFSQSQPMNGLFPAVSNFSSTHGRVGSLPSTMNLVTSAALAPDAVDCRCGVMHSQTTDCLEYMSLSVIHDAHVALTRNPQLMIWTPRNPTLSNLMLHTTGDNPLTLVLGNTLRNFKAGNTEAFFGIYFLCYRLLRWRLYPNAETLADVPPPMRYTQAQIVYPHPVAIDCLPWPGLRSYLCQNQNQDARHCVALYIESFKLLWPPDKELLCRGENGEMVLHEEFEAIVSDLRNWRLGAPWTDAFPHLMKYMY